MKKKITFGIFLFFLLGIGNNVAAATFTAVKSGQWQYFNTWLPAGTDSTGLSLPTYTDDVIIPAGDSVAVISGAVYCQNLTVNGTLYSNATFCANGNITVNNGGVFSLNSNVYCKNVYNYGKFWNVKSGYNSSKYLCIGYSNAGTSSTNVASTDSCTIVNDGIFGWYRSASLSGAYGCGFFVEYSNQAKAVNITHSNAVTSGYVFTVNGLFPAKSPSGAAASTAATQDQNLYINESMALIASASPLEFSLQNGDTFNGYNRTCTIAAGDTVFVAGFFHTKASAPGVGQGNMTYNIYGCLDMASANRNKNEFDLYTSATSPYVAVNVKNGGTLVFGKTINLNQSAAGQTTAINAEAGSKVKFGYSLSAPTITATNTTFPSSLCNLEIATGTYSVTLPSALNVSSSLTLTSGKLALGSNNLTAGSILGGSSTSYVVTNGTGTLTQTASASGTLFPVGTTTGYAPVTITPASDDIISANVSATTTGTFTGYGVNADEWTLTPATATTATLGLTPEAATYASSPVIFSGTGYAAKTDATLSGSTFTASGISLAALATPFATGGLSPATALVSNTTNNLLVYPSNNALVVKNAREGDLITVYGLTGLKVASSVVNSDNTTMTLMPGTYIVKIGSKIQKVLVQ